MPIRNASRQNPALTHCSYLECKRLLTKALRQFYGDNTIFYCCPEALACIEKQDLTLWKISHISFPMNGIGQLLSIAEGINRINSFAVLGL